KAYGSKSQSQEPPSKKTRRSPHYGRSTSLSGSIGNEARHPLRHRGALVVVVQAGHAALVDRFPQVFAANLQQRPRIVVDEFRVALEAQHLVLDAVGGDRAELAGRQHGGVLRRLRYLVLVA